MTKPNDLQRTLLATAVARPNGSLLPLPEGVTLTAARLASTVAALIERGLAEERPTRCRAECYRSDGRKHFAAIISDAGRALVAAPSESDAQTEPAPAAAPPVAPPGTSKIATVLQLLQREQGATIAEMVDATGWLPHTTRAALTGLRKKGHVLDKHKRADLTCYSIAAGA